jgi:hypothetical protein
MATYSSGMMRFRGAEKQDVIEGAVLPGTFSSRLLTLPVQVGLGVNPKDNALHRLHATTFPYFDTLLLFLPTLDALTPDNFAKFQNSERRQPELNAV